MSLCSLQDDGSAYYTDSYNVLIYGGYKNYLGHDKTSHSSLYLYPDGLRFYSLPTFAEQQLMERAGLGDDAWGVSCMQQFSPAVGDSGFEERYYNNTCILQSSGSVYTFPFGGCEATNPSYQSAMPITYSNTFYTPAATPFVLMCNINGTSTKLDFQSWKATGKDANSVQLSTNTSTLTPLLSPAAQLLGMDTSQK